MNDQPLDHDEARPRADGTYVFAFPQFTKDELARRVDDFFIKKEGYRLEAGEVGTAIYGIGSTFWRILFGVFAKRYRFSVRITQGEDGGAQLTFAKEMTGISGGIFGMRSLNKEFARIASLLFRIA